MMAIFMIASHIKAQVGINNDGSQPDPSAMLDVKSTSKGILVPRLTFAERDAIILPATGLLIFCTSNNQFYSNKGTPAIPNWIMVSSQWFSSGSDIYFFGGKVGIGTTNPQNKLDITGNAVIGSSYSGTLIAPTNGLLIEGRVGIGTSSPTTAAALEVTSTNCGFLPPRMTTTQRNAILNPPAGLIIFNSESKALNIFDGTTWVLLMPVYPSFICGQSFTDYRNGQVYNTVLIGTQCWMAQNLNIGTMINDSLDQTNNQVIERYCYNMESNCDIYGGQYKWNEAMQYVTTEGVQGICPVGWHLPTDAEWTTLTTFLGGESVAGGKMKETGTTHWASPNTGATNSSGFTALPGGVDRYYPFVTLYAYFWSSSEFGSMYAWYRNLSYDDAYANRNNIFYNNKTLSLSVRCLKD